MAVGGRDHDPKQIKKGILMPIPKDLQVHGHVWLTELC